LNLPLPSWVRIASARIERAELPVLDWLEQQASRDGFWPAEISVQDVVLACLILWSEARGAIEWRGRPQLENIVAHLKDRPSFLATAPQKIPVTGEPPEPRHVALDPSSPSQE
jgi:glutathione S-transferase